MKTQTPQQLETLRRWILAHSSIYIYGTGAVGRETAQLLLTQHVTVKGFLEHRNIPDSAIGNVPVISSKENNLSDKEKEVSLLLIGIFNPEVNLRALKCDLAKRGWGQVLTFNEYHQAFYEELGDRYWLTNKTTNQQMEGKMRALRSLWKDEKSRELHDSIVAYRESCDCNILHDPDIAFQYFPQDVPGWPSALDFVDCGAYTGDTLRRIRELNLNLRSYVGLEPDVENFRVLVSEVKSATKQFGFNAVALPCGTYDETCQLGFEASKGAGSSLCAEGESVVQCVAIDDVFHDRFVNVIKMDVEGAEVKSLLGAEATIRKYSPNLAICVYHQPEHIWQIPFMVQEWDLGYNFYLRGHCYNCFDLVMYAVAETGGRR